MASFNDLQLDWSSLESTDCWTESDLQLAAELGKTLLERNKELETALRQHQTIIEDQTQEIEYLTKQTAALREVNDSRLRIYEQLEVSIQDLERGNHRLAVENAADKKQIKTLTQTIENLESKCEELQVNIDSLRLQNEDLKRKSEKSPEVDKRPTKKTAITPTNHEESPEITAIKTPPCQPKPKTQTPSIKTTPVSRISCEEQTNGNDQTTQLLEQLKEVRTQNSKDQRKINELEEQLATVVKQNQTLENQIIELHNKDDMVKSMHDELNTLEEVRKGQLCSRCLRNVDRSEDEILEDDDSSMLEELMSTSQHRTSFSLDVQDHTEHQTSPKSSNPYKDLVEKYEALLEVHRKPVRKPYTTLKDELQETKDTDDECDERVKKLRTPTEFSEAETTSSGFSDETSNKGTQTEAGAFLCSIADGDDCRFSIYDDNGPMTSRFRHRPEYQQLFKEIFAVLKNAAENKASGDDLPLAEPKVVQPIIEETPESIATCEEDEEETQSVLSSTVSELSVTPNENEIKETVKEERVLKPLVRQPLEYVSVEVRKRSASRRKNRYVDRSDSPQTQIIGSPKIQYSNRPTSGRRRREMRTPPQDGGCENWNGNTIEFWSSKYAPRSPTVQNRNSPYFEYKPSSASQDLHKLKKLDLSYAEVLRNADTKKVRPRKSK